MAELPFLHPALLGVGVGVAVAWSAVMPERLRGAVWTATAAVLAAGVAALLGWVPWLGGLRFTAYGVCMLFAFAAAWWIARRRAMRIGIDPYLVRTQAAIAAVAGILGARIWYVIEYHHHFPDPTQDWSRWLSLAADLDRGGAVWYGGLLLAGTALVIHARRAGMPLIPWSDCAAPAVLTGLGIGRIGCFCNGCCFGSHTDLPWGVTRQVGSLIDHVHPTQLYETGVCLVLAWLTARAEPGRGIAAGWALIGYALWRAFNETLRADYGVNQGMTFSLSPFHMTSAQWTALPLLALGTWLLLRARSLPVAPAAT